MTFDGATKDPIQMAVRDALIAFMAATAQAQAEATKEAQTAGIKAARQAGDAGNKYRGRKPTFDVEQLHRTRELLSMGRTPSAIAVEIGIPRATVYRIKGDPGRAVALLEFVGASRRRPEGPDGGARLGREPVCEGQKCGRCGHPPQCAGLPVTAIERAPLTVRLRRQHLLRGGQDILDAPQRDLGSGDQRGRWRRATHFDVHTTDKDTLDKFVPAAPPRSVARRAAAA